MGVISNWLWKRLRWLSEPETPAVPDNTKAKEDKNTLKVDKPFLAQNDTAKPKRVVSEETRAKLRAAALKRSADKKAAEAKAIKEAAKAPKPTVSKKATPAKKTTKK